MDEPNLPPSPAVIEQAIEDADEQIGEVEELLAEHAIQSELRHEEILEEIETCRESLATLQEQSQTLQGESPLLSRIMETLTALQSEVSALRAEVIASRNSPPPSPPPSQTPEDSHSTPQPSPSPNLPEGAVLPEQEVPAAPARKKKRRLI